MENSVNTMKSSSTHSLRNRKSIFASNKPKGDQQEPKLLLNRETVTQWPTQRPLTSPNFYQKESNSMQQNNQMYISHQRNEERRVTGSFCLPQNKSPISRVIITNPNQPICVRPSSVGKSSVIINKSSRVEECSSFLTPSKIVSPQPQVLTCSRIIPSQTSNINPNIIISQAPSHLKKRSIIVEGRPHQNVIFRHSPIKTQQIQIISQIIPQRSQIIIQDDPKTVSELNKLASLNQFLGHQYSIVNNELHYIKSRTCQKQVVDDVKFLQKSLNRIDDIFLRQTNEALYKLDEISRYSSSKGFSRSSKSRVKRDKSPTFNKTAHDTTSSGIYTPIKGVQMMQNSRYMECNHVNPMSVYYQA